MRENPFLRSNVYAKGFPLTHDTALAQVEADRARLLADSSMDDVHYKKT
jgi:hypothetical protein